MRYPAVVIVSALLVSVFLSPTLAAQSATSTGAPASAVQVVQNPQALSVLTQALTVGGGAQPVTSISDYTATGNITYYPGEQVQGTVTVIGMNSTDVRMDATLPSGVRSWAVDNGIVSTKSETGAVSSLEPKTTVPSSDAFPYQTPLFPASLLFPVRPLGTLTAHQAFSMSYNGTTTIDGHTVHDIKMQRGPATTSSANTPILRGRTREIFIDTTTLQIVMVRDTLPKNVMQEVHYANYQAVSGVLMPFSITEYIAGQELWSIQLNQITFNSGLQESAFAIQ